MDSPQVVDTPSRFHAISIPDDYDFKDDDNPIPEDLVFERIQDASKILNKYKDARIRMKTFRNRTDAVAFAVSGQSSQMNKTVDSITFSPRVKQEKQEKDYPSPRNQDIIQLKRAIETKDHDKVKSMIWNNPRLLITDCDLPVILMAGARYNACHIAARAGEAKILKLILDTISSIEYMKKLDPLASETTLMERINLLVDSYLNTPDKCLGNTSLHFACSKGFEDVIKVLLSYKDCNRDCKDVHGRKPEEVICERATQRDKAKEERIRCLFRASLFLPIYRDGASAKVGKPVPFIKEDFCVQEITNVSVSYDLNCSINSTTSSISDKPRLVALAGPMLPEQAEELYNILKAPRKAGKTPSSPIANGNKGSPKQVFDEHKRIRCSDDQKGVERIAREMCHKMDIQWVEYWPFLDDLVDLSSEMGLNMLERYMRSVYDKLNLYNDLADLFSMMNIDKDVQSSFTSSAFFENSFVKQDECHTSKEQANGSTSEEQVNGSTSEEQANDSTSEEQANDPTSEEQANGSISEEKDVGTVEDVGDDMHEEVELVDDEKFYTPPGSPVMAKEFYVNGTTKPSKWDFRVLVALNDTVHLVDDNNYFFVKDWLKRMKKISNKSVVKD